ncbi:NAD+ synthase [Desulfovibrio cuneatus]|uniref:NAD+ synthase n=1 Tax=Desulfovibrio cuneatus TaxID=159728 RepID=UPI000420FA32|nr:NAD+ synthase [Desulfovibrio cuneatus]
MNIGIVQHNPMLGDFAGNSATLLAQVAKAAAQGAALCVAPGWALCGGGAGNLLQRNVFAQANQEALPAFAKAHAAKGLPPVLLGVAIAAHGAAAERQHAAVLVENGTYTVVARQCFTPHGAGEQASRILVPGEPCGLVRVGGHRFAVLLGEASLLESFPEEESLLCDCLQHHRVAGICILGALPYRHFRREKVMKNAASMAQRHGTSVFLANLAGGTDSNVFYGGSFACNAKGQLLALAPLFQEAVVQAKGEATPLQGEAAVLAGREEALWQALVTGTRDFVRKCGLTRVVLGLSGGMDSALVAAIAAEALGPENVMGLLLPSPYSSQGSIDHSLELAANVGIATHTVPIEPVLDAARHTMEAAFPPGLTGLAGENIQARIRGMLLMAYANQFGAMLLNTSNKSESAVGYSTLYGDSCGGLGVIADVYKTETYALARWLNARNGKEVIPSVILQKAPSAELRPDQKDSDSLPPYEVLDKVLYLLVEEGKSRAEVVAAGFDSAVVNEVRRLMDGSEFKRRQTPPALHVSAQPFGPEQQLPLAMRAMCK